MDKYARIRDENLKEHTRRFKEVTESYEDIRSLLEKRRMLQGGFDLVLSDDTAFADYTKRIRELNSEVKARLKAHGLPENYLEPIYNCPLCEDKGFYYEDDVHPVRCKCNQRESFTFSDFNLNLFSKEKAKGAKLSPYEHMESTLNFAKDYCDAFPHNNRRNILFYGASGLGKSFLACCMCSELTAKGFSAFKVNAFKLIEDFKEKHVHDVSYPLDYYGCDFLVIDDIGTEPMYNKITLEYLFSLVNERIETGKATLFITNQSYESCCNRYDERLASRMFDALITTPIAFIGSNLRLVKRQ